MKKYRNNAGLVVIAFIIAVTSIACGTTAHIEKDKSVNFNRYKTYSWLSEEEKPLKEKNSNHLTDRNIKHAVAKQLEKAGWVETKARPDIVLDYNIMVENTVREQNNPVYSRPFTRYYYNPVSRRIIGFYTPSQMLGYESLEIPYKEGTITLHMIDNKTNRLVWQGWTSDAVNSHNLTSKEVNAGIKAILKKFDPKAEG